MKAKFPLLEQMRTAREQREASAIAPFIWSIKMRDQEVQRAWGAARAMASEKAALMRGFMHPFAARLRDVMTDEMAAGLVKAIDKAIIEARGKESLDAEVKVSINLMEHADRDSIVRYVTDYYLAHMEAEANVRQRRPYPTDDDSPISDEIHKVQHLEISIPAVACSRELVMVDPIRIPYPKRKT